MAREQKKKQFSKTNKILTAALLFVPQISEQSNII